MRRVTNDAGKFRCFTMTEIEFRELDNNYQGLCVACGEEADGVEPDARKCECEGCGKPTVYGVHELILVGRIEIEE